jgi:hypothetical protein
VLEWILLLRAQTFITDVRELTSYLDAAIGSTHGRRFVKAAGLLTN